MTEPKFTKISHEILEALYSRSRPIYQVRVVLFLLRQTCGYHREHYRSSIARLALQVNIPRAAAHLTIKQLLAEGLIGESGGAWFVQSPHFWR